MKLRAVVSTVILAAALSACGMFPVGPDLTKAPSPFGSAPVVHFIGDDNKVTEIRHTALGDTAVLDFSSGGESGRSYEAAITWLPVGNGGDAAHDYWLAGANIFRTADRSAYLVMRYPHGLKLAPPMKSDAFETMLVTCHMRGVEAFPSFDEDEASDGSSSSSPDSAPKKVCDFADRADLDAFVPTVLAKAQSADADGDTDYKWDHVTIELP